MLYGPNTNQGSIMFMLERQTDYIMRQLARMDDEKLAWVDIRKEVMDDFNSKLQAKLLTIGVWQAQCGNDAYYRSGPNRRMVVAWPGSMDAYEEATTRTEPESFEVVEASHKVVEAWAR
jgi:hypothetical protein